MRGKASKQLKPFLKDRITPAYAGKRFDPSDYVLNTRDHPRLCGEKSKRRAACSCSVRITPAYAGKRKFLFFAEIASQDHPRLCGEKGSWKTR